MLGQVNTSAPTPSQGVIDNSQESTIPFAGQHRIQKQAQQFASMYSNLEDFREQLKVTLYLSHDANRAKLELEVWNSWSEARRAIINGNIRG